MSRDRTKTDDEKLAEATLLALRMTLNDPDEGGDIGYCLLPHQAPLDRTEITSRLARMDKPVTCIAIGVGGLLGVCCWPLPIEDLHSREHQALRLEERNTSIRRQLADESGSANVLLLGYGSKMLLSWDQYVEWQRQYFLYTLQSNLLVASSQQREEGAQGVLQIYGIRKNGGTGGGITKSLPKVDPRS